MTPDELRSKAREFAEIYPPMVEWQAKIEFSPAAMILILGFAAAFAESLEPATPSARDLAERIAQRIYREIEDCYKFTSHWRTKAADVIEEELKR